MICAQPNQRLQECRCRAAMWTGNLCMVRRRVASRRYILRKPTRELDHGCGRARYRSQQRQGKTRPQRSGGVDDRAAGERHRDRTHRAGCRVRLVLCGRRAQQLFDRNHEPDLYRRSRGRHYAARARADRPARTRDPRPRRRRARRDRAARTLQQTKRGVSSARPSSPHSAIVRRWAGFPTCTTVPFRSRKPLEP